MKHECSRRDFLKAAGVGVVSVMAMGSGSGVFAAGSGRPNIIIMHLSLRRQIAPNFIRL